MKDLNREGFTVKSLFEVPELKDAILLGGRSGLDHVITRVNVMEVPDVVDWVRKGELLMTTGYPFREYPEKMAFLVEQLAQRGVAALAIKTKRFFETVPAEVIEAADRCKLPLIELPPSATFSDLVREIMERVLVSESKDLMILQTRVQRLSQLLLQGDGLVSFLKHMYDLISNPVVLIDYENTIIVPDELQNWFKEIEQQEWEKWHKAEQLESSMVRIGNEAYYAHSILVHGDLIKPYRLIVVEQYSPYTTVDSLTVNWGSRLLGLEISNMEARKSIEVKYFDQFVQDWLSGRMVSSVDLHLRAEACGWQLENFNAYVVGAVSLWDGRVSVKELQHIIKALRWESDLQQGIKLMWTLLEGEIMFLISQSSSNPSEEQYKSLLHTIHAQVKSAFSDKKITLCMSRVVEKATDVASAYRETKRVMEIRKVYRTQDEILHYNQLGVYLLLYRMQGTDEMEEFKQLYLYPLLAMERKQQGALLTTLATYFDCNCNAKETAERLYVHYNTVNYRLERISHELGLRLDNSEMKLLLQLALKIYYLQEN